MSNLSKEQDITIKVKDGIMKVIANDKTTEIIMDYNERSTDMVWAENIIAMANSLVFDK